MVRFGTLRFSTVRFGQGDKFGHTTVGNRLNNFHVKVNRLSVTLEIRIFLPLTEERRIIVIVKKLFLFYKLFHLIFFIEKRFELNLKKANYLRVRFSLLFVR